DCQKPCRCARGPIRDESPHRAKRAKEHFLSEIFDVRTRPERARQIGEHQRLVADNEPPKCLRVARPARFERLEVELVVDRLDRGHGLRDETDSHPDRYTTVGAESCAETAASQRRSLDNARNSSVPARSSQSKTIVSTVVGIAPVRSQSAIPVL